MKAVILAAGKGKRLHSEQFSAPKVLREANGKPLLRYVVNNLSFIPDKKDIIIVAGYKKEMVFNAFNEGYTFSVQDEALGTGHAVNWRPGSLKRLRWTRSGLLRRYAPLQKRDLRKPCKGP